MEKVSVIIPNYNGEKFIRDCVNSVINQKYLNTEIIIIDDGSSDKSIEIINDIIKENKEIDIKLICQNNLNAAIARNEGLKQATGRYVLFLDSDDIIDNDILEYSVNLMKKNNVELLIGNFVDIDEDNNIIKERKFFNEERLIQKNEILDKLYDVSPVPSNKIYDMNIIKKFNISWGNVRIGQDLNFYLKYLSCCENVFITNKNMYKYRIVNNSISRRYDFRIFDIVNSLLDVKKFYHINQKDDLYDKYIQILELKHYNFQIVKVPNFETKMARKIIVDYFKLYERNIDYRKCVNNDKNYKKLRLKFRLKCMFKLIYTSDTYRYLKKKRGNK